MKKQVISISFHFGPGNALGSFADYCQTVNTECTSSVSHESALCSGASHKVSRDNVLCSVLRDSAPHSLLRENVLCSMKMHFAVCCL